MREILRSRRSLTPGVESLEAMTLLSGLAMPAVAHAAEVGMPTAMSTAVHVNGTTRGEYVRVRANPDTGSTYDFNTTGILPGFGVAAVSGSVQTPGNIATGTASGSLTLFSLKGTLTLKVSSASLPSFSPLPSKLTFTITGGTGAFAGATGSGTIAVALHQTFGRGPMLTGGAVTLTFHSA
jgi:hypothetical protein